MCISKKTFHSLKWPKVGANKPPPAPLSSASVQAKAHVAGFPEGWLAAEEDPTRLLSPRKGDHKHQNIALIISIPIMIIIYYHNIIKMES